MTTSPTIREAIDTLTAQVSAMTDVLKRMQTGSGGCSEPQLVYDCSTETYQWIYPDSSGGWVGAGGLDTDGDGTILTDGTIPGFDGDTDTNDYGIGYGNAGTTPPDGSADWSEFDLKLCARAHWFYDKAGLLLEEWTSISDPLSLGGDVVHLISQGLSAKFGGLGVYIGERFVRVVGTSATAPLTVTHAIGGLIGSAISSWVKDEVMQHWRDNRANLICAIYCGKSAAGIKKRWDDVADSMWSLPPWRGIIKRLMYADMANALAKGTVLNDPNYSETATCTMCDCDEGLITITSQEVWYNRGDGAASRTQHIIWSGQFSPNEGDNNGLSGDEERWITEISSGDPLNGFVLQDMDGWEYRVIEQSTRSEQLLYGTTTLAAATADGTWRAFPAGHSFYGFTTSVSPGSTTEYSDTFTIEIRPV